MKQYQDHDPLHGNGKAVPKPKRPTQYTYRGAGGGFSVDRDTLYNEREARRAANKAAKSHTAKAKIGFGLRAAVAAVLGFTRRFARGNPNQARKGGWLV